MTSTTNPAESFPKAELTKLANDKKPTFQDIKILQKEIFSNAMTIPTTRGGGGHGYLALCMPVAEYNAMPTTADWTDPVHPGPNPTIVNPPTQHTIAEGNRIHKLALEEYATFKAIEAALPRCLTTAIPNTYINVLEDDLYGYANVAPRAIITHMKTTYGTITADDLNKNFQELQKPWSSDRPLEDLWTQVRRCRNFAQAHDPITELAAIREMANNLKNSGVFTQDLKDWCKKTTDNTTIAHFHEKHVMVKVKEIFVVYVD